MSRALDPGSLAPLFTPSSIALIGASTDPSKVGGMPQKFLMDRGYEGAIYPINPAADEVQGRPAFGSIADVPGDVDLAVIAVPAAGVIPAIEQAAAKGARAAIIFSSGFSELSAEGAAQQIRLSEIADEAGMRILGPNCMGMFSVPNQVYCTFGTAFGHYGGKGWPAPGGVGLISQSGSVGMHLFSLLRDRGIGFSRWAATGNQANIEAADMIAYMAADPETTVIASYMEGCPDMDRLAEALELARAAQKPVIMFKVGVSELGSGAARLHTASDAGDDDAMDALFADHGALRVCDMNEMEDAIYAASHNWYPARQETGIVSISGGVGIVMADEAAKVGISLPELPETSQQKVRELVPMAATRNPVDLTASWLRDLKLMGITADTMFEDADLASAIIYLSSVGMDPAFAEKIREGVAPVAQKHPTKALALSMRANREVCATFEKDGVLVFDDPSRAVRTVAAMGWLKMQMDIAP